MTLSTSIQYPFAIMLNGSLSKAFKVEKDAREYFNEMIAYYGAKNKTMKFEFIDRSAT